MPELLFTFQGRIGVKQFWGGIFSAVASALALAVVIGLVIGIGSIVIGATQAQQEIATLVGSGIVTLYAVLTQLAVIIKRCHDQGRSGWWCLLTLIPFIGLLWVVLDLGTQRGKPATPPTS